MTNYELIKERHSVRQYLSKPIEEEKRKILNDFALSLNEKYGTHIQIKYDDEAGFKNGKADYGLFSNCQNYIALVGKDPYVCGYVGELMVIKAQELGLNTCFVALTYERKYVKNKLEINQDEKLQCNIALGYGKTQGHPRRSKTKEQVLVLKGNPPDCLDKVVDACLLAPTAINQQKFKVLCTDGKFDVKKSGIGVLLDLDAGIVKANMDLVLEECGYEN